MKFNNINKEFFSKLLFINGINLLIFYQQVKEILLTEIVLLSPNKWILYLIGVTLFSIWIFFCSLKILKLNMYIYITCFILCLGTITYFSQNIVYYQDQINIEKANIIIGKVERGEKIENMNYWLGLSNYYFRFQERDSTITALIFNTTQGNFRTYYFKNKVWVVAD